MQMRGENVVDKAVAKQKFREADKRYQAEDFEGSLEILEELEDEFPANHRIMFPMARCMSKLERNEEALDICQDLVEKHQYAKAEPLYRALRAKVYQQEAQDWKESEDGEEADEKEGLFQRLGIKPVRLLILIGLLYGMYAQYVPYWLGGGIIVAYFVIKKIVGMVMYRLFSVPFIMKGKAMKGAGATVHSISNIPAPTDFDPRDSDQPEASIFYMIEVTIVPQDTSEGFTSWEPTELHLAPFAQRIKKLDDLEKAYQVHSVSVVGEPPNPPETEDDDDDDGGGKYQGPMRLKLTVGLPAGGGDYKFGYYLETFGQFTLPPA